MLVQLVSHSHIHEKVVATVQVALLQANSHGQKSSWMESVSFDPSLGCEVTLLMNGMSAGHDSGLHCGHERQEERSRLDQHGDLEKCKGGGRGTRSP